MDNVFLTLLHQHNGFGVLEDSAEAQSVSSASGWTSSIEPTPSITPPMLEVPELVISDESTPASSSILTPVEPLGEWWMSRKIQSQDLIAAAEQYWWSSVAGPDQFPAQPNFYSPPATTIPWLPQADYSIAAGPNEIFVPSTTPPHFSSPPTMTPSWIPQADFPNPHFSSPPPSWFPQADFPDPQLPAAFPEVGSTDTPDLNVDVGCSMPKGKAKGRCTVRFLGAIADMLCQQNGRNRVCGMFLTGSIKTLREHK
jgi:hypothetical protein